MFEGMQRAFGVEEGGGAAALPSPSCNTSLHPLALDKAAPLRSSSAHLGPGMPQTRAICRAGGGCRVSSGPMCL